MSKVAPSKNNSGWIDRLNDIIMRVVFFSALPVVVFILWMEWGEKNGRFTLPLAAGWMAALMVSYALTAVQELRVGARDSALARGAIWRCCWQCGSYSFSLLEQSCGRPRGSHA